MTACGRKRTFARISVWEQKNLRSVSHLKRARALQFDL